jgi:UPF0755 protein
MARRKTDDQAAMPAEGEVAAQAERGGWFSSRLSRRNGTNSAARPAPPPPPPKKRRKEGLIALFSGLFTVFAVLAVVAVGGFMFAFNEYSRPGPLAMERTVLIERGSSSEEVVDLMQREGVIAHSTLFWAALLFRDVQSKFVAEEGSNRRVKSGEYQFRPQASMGEVIDIITSGRSVQHSITIPEGLTSEQIVERLKESDLLVGEVAAIPPEGSLLPDTYRVDRGTSREALLNRMQREQKRVLQEAWNRRAKDSILKSPRELLTLASIVEKETGRADERPRVAGVFYNRLEKKMRLESDPTIIYGLVGGKGVLGRGLTRAEIDQTTPYNTYRINGLPPGPISNPGRAALEATANPSRTKDLFFVADGTGGHVFAETYAQHLRNVERWRQIEANRPRDLQRQTNPQEAASPSGAALAAPSAPAFAAPPVAQPQSAPPVSSPAASPAPEQQGALERSTPASREAPAGFGAPQRRLEAASGPSPLPMREATGSTSPPAIAAPARPEQPRPRPIP